MPVAIAGMHRAGTSLIARMLGACGLELGPVEQHLPPQADNPEGFYEHRAFVDLNERLLAQLGGIWRMPPSLISGWENDPKLDPLYAEARSLTVEFNFREPWGWKDPRNSLTLPFWRCVFPDLAVVICVRHPLETAYSLLERDHLPIHVGLALWSAYYRQALTDAAPGRRVVVHYAAFFERPEMELRRLLAAISLPADAQTVQNALATITSKMRHSQLGDSALRALHADPDLIALYQTLGNEAGWTSSDHDESLAGEMALRDALTRLERSLDACVRKSWVLMDQERHVLARAAKLDEQEAMIAGQRAYIDEREKYIGVMQAHLALLGQQVAEFEERLSARRHRYAEAVANAAQRMLQPFRRTWGTGVNGSTPRNPAES